MERSNSTSSNNSTASGSNIFGYQKQLLESGSPLSRSNSRSAGILPRAPVATSSNTPIRRWTVGHRTGQSVDAVRSKWEEKIARETSPERSIRDEPSFTKPSYTSLPSPALPTVPDEIPSAGMRADSAFRRTLYDSPDLDTTPRKKPEFPSSITRQSTLPLTAVTNLNTKDTHAPASPVRRVDSIRSKWESASPERESTSSFPIISKTLAYASTMPMTPDVTGSSTLTRSDSVSSTSSGRRLDSLRNKWEQRKQDADLHNGIEEASIPSYRSNAGSPLTSPITSTSPWNHPTPATPVTTRPYIPPTPSSSSSSLSSVEAIRAKWGLPSREGFREPESREITPLARKRHTLPAPPTHSTVTELKKDNPPSQSVGVGFSRPAPSHIHLSTSTDLQSSSVSAVKRLGSFAIPSPERVTYPASTSRIESVSQEEYKPPPLSPSALSAMFPTPYRSSHMAKKNYGASLTDGRRLGRHLPRIASGDAQSEEEESPLLRRGAQRRRRQEASEELIIPGITGASDVTGVPGRLRLSRASKANTPAPLPSSRLTVGLWADVQRNLLQAYEYLCHVGEAQQWIEGCLGEELGFGVVEMEDGLRNGVVLAKLIRVFKGDAAIKKIYEAKKLDYRHSDNINHFLQFIRGVGLPECFIFETLDLYEKKNFPKVVYSIHALSHLLARRGMAERIGNLLGQLKFSDDQLQQTQKGLEHSGVPLPNFGGVGRELAKEINEEPDMEIESEDERRDRLLLENESSIISLQAHSRRHLLQRDYLTKRARLHLAEPAIQKLQASCRALLTRNIIRKYRTQHASLSSLATKFQAAARGVLARRQWSLQKQLLLSRIRCFVAIQAQSRGALQRRRFARLKAALKSCKFTVTKLQTLSRAKLAKRYHKELKKSLDTRLTVQGIAGLQGVARGLLQRRRLHAQRMLLVQAEPCIVSLQAQVRGLLARRRVRAHLAKLTNITDIVVRLQAAVRAYLAGKRLLNLIRGLRKSTASIVSLQTRARAALARQKRKEMSKALSEVKTVQSVGGFQALARAALTRNRQREQSKRLEFCVPDVVGVQAACRGIMSRNSYWAWRNHLHNSIAEVITLQSLLRGCMQRQKFRSKMAYYRANLDKVVKIQSLMRAKDTREQYRRLTLGQNVNVSTIKNFVHLLDDSEADFKEEMEVEKLREQLVKNIRENQALETDVSELDVKIALVVQNVKSFEELIKAKRRHGVDSAAAHAARASVLAAHGDPFAGPSTLDHSTKRKRELYQQLFYLLQTRSEYLARLFFAISKSDLPDKTRQLSERVVLTLFAYGQNRREDFLLLKFFQHAIHEEVNATSSVEELAQAHPMFMNIAVQYVRPKQVAYVRESFQAIIREVIDQDELDLETDPSVLHRNHVNIEEMRTGKVSSTPKDVSFHEAIEDFYPETRGEYIRNLQRLLTLTKAFVEAIIASAKRSPYGIRYIAHETLTALRLKFPEIPAEVLASSVGRQLYYRFINTAIVTPETFDIVHNTIGSIQRKNLTAISRVLTRIASGNPFQNEDISLVPLNDYVTEAIKQISGWFLEVADVPEPEVQLNAYEFLDVAVQPKPIFISPNEVYSMHRLLLQHIQSLAPRRDDALRIILHELDGVPNLGSEELNDARDRSVTLELTNRFAEVEDPHAAEKALWVQAKRSVLAILRVQPAKDLIESLMQPVAEEHESIWEEIVDHDLLADEIRHHERRASPLGGAEAAYRLEDIQSLSFREVKAHAISCLLRLEKQNKVTRADGYQGILDAIAGDVRSKHRKRLERQKEMESMHDALTHLAERKKYYLEQIDSYNNYVEAAMQTMQRGKGKKRFVMPFTKQYFHLRDLQRTGQSPQFGSYKYSAQDLYDKGILLSIDQYSPRQFDKIDVVLSSNTVGVFAMEIHNTNLGAPNHIASTDLRLSDLLQAQFENKVSLALFNGMAKVNVNLLLYQINKKFYV